MGTVMTDPEIDMLIAKAHSEGLTYDEKARLYLLTTFTSNSQPKCRCFKHGEKCKVHPPRHDWLSAIDYEP
jgi:hypothetical protein